MSLHRTQLGLCISASLLVLALTAGGCRGGQQQFLPRRLPGFTNRGEQPRQPEAVRLNDEQTLDVQLAMARTLEQQGDLERAEAMYRALNEQHPNQPAVQHRLAIICDRQNRFEEGEQLFQAALVQNQNDATLLADYGYSLYRQKRWSEAERMLRRAIASRPGERRAHNHLGLVLCETDRQVEALKEFARAGCTQGEAHMNAALVLTMNDRFEEARHQFRMASTAGVASPETAARAQHLDRMLSDGGVEESTVTLVGGTASASVAEPSHSKAGRALLAP